MALAFPKSRARVLTKRDAKRDRDAAYRKVCTAVKKRDGGRCRNCGAFGTDVHHILARSLGGKDTTANCVLLDRDCHRLVQQHALRIIGEDANKRLRFEVSQWMK